MCTGSRPSTRSGKLVAEQIEAAGGVAKEFNTIAVDDGIAMGHGACFIHCHLAN
ncbi:hypothetical protein DMI70_00115 [Escherichia coli]|nr:hypothetical protein [Escherichia coli]